MALDWKLVVDVAAIVIALCALGVTAVTQISRSARATATADDVKDLWTAVDVVKTRVAAVEAHHQHLPTHSDLAGLREAISSLTATVAELKGSHSSTGDTLKQMQNTLQQLVENELRGSA